MAIRKPTAPGAKSQAMAELLSGVSTSRGAKFVPGSIIKGKVSAIK